MQDPGPRTLPRKLREGLTALELVRRHGREAVLAHYLRIAPYGNRIHGIAYAARRYLQKPVEDLSWAEISLLSAIPQAPGRMNPCSEEGLSDAIRRGRRILSALRARGEIPEEEYAVAIEQIGRLRIPPLDRRPVEAMHAVLRLREELRDPKTRRSLASRPVLVASLDLDLQREVVAQVDLAMKSFEDPAPGNVSVVVADKDTREILAWIGSVRYDDPESSGAVDFARVLRPAGSTLKPFLYALALERGAITPATVLTDNRRGPGGIENADGAFLGALLPREALANSRNVPAARLLEQLGLEEGYAFLGQLGLHRYRHPARRYGVGMAVGNLPVSLERLVGAYGALASDGVYSDLVWRKAPSHASAAGRKVLSRNSVRQVGLFLSDPLARLPSFPRMGANEYAYPVAVKTGTSTGYRDAWTVAWSNRFVVGVWAGNPDASPMKNLGGFSAASGIVRRILDVAHSGQTAGLNDLGFPPPEGHYPVGVCALTGKRAGDGCPRVFVEWFPEGREPQEDCDKHLPAAAVPLPDDGNPPATIFPPAGGKEIRMSVVAPADATRILSDPETPPEQSTLPLEAAVYPRLDQVVWYVDGRPFRVVEFPYSTRWPIAPGVHTFQVRHPSAGFASRPVHVNVR
jgi:penicillin-binding protein 1C